MTSQQFPQCATCEFYHVAGQCPVVLEARRQFETHRSSFDRVGGASAYVLMPEWLAPIMPKLYEQDDVRDPIVWAKWFTPDSSWTWYVTEFSATAPDGTPNLAFGFVDGFEAELGYISLDEVEQARGPMGLRIERDLWFVPTPLSEIRAKIGR